MKLSTINSSSIVHIEDLKIPVFIDVIKKLKNFVISEKVDGSCLQFGMDNVGFFTGRENRGGDRVYECADYPLNYATTYQRSAHLALEKVLDHLKDAGLGVGDLIEAEILFGKLPNVVPYDTNVNRIILLRKIEGDCKLDDIRERLIGLRVEVQISAPRTIDGKSVRISDETHVWEFAQTPTFSVSSDAMKDVNAALAKFEEYLNQPSIIPELTVRDVLTCPLNKRHQSVPPENWKNVKVEIKNIRNECNSIVDAYYKDVKSELLQKLVRQTASAFGPSIDEGGWVEGVVCEHKHTKQRFKIVDKDKFGKVKDFLWDQRNQLRRLPASTSEQNLSFMGNIYMTMANSIGVPELGTIYGYLRKRKGVMHILDESITFDEIKTLWLSLMDQKEKELDNLLEDYLETYTNVSEVICGQTFTVNYEIYERDLQEFTNTYSKINSLRDHIYMSKTLEHLVNIL